MRNTEDDHICVTVNDPEVKHFKNERAKVSTALNSSNRRIKYMSGGVESFNGAEFEITWFA